MLREELIFVGTCDIAGHVRGKGFPVGELPLRRKKGIGWTHSNLMQTAFGPIFDTLFGTGGDLMIVPDPEAEVRVDFADGSAPEHFFLGNIENTDSSPWECCPREFLRRSVEALKEESGLELIAAFEQEFVYTGNEERPGDAYSLGAFRRQGVFGESLVASLRAAGVAPDSFLPEYGPRQFEVTVKPQSALKAADQAVIARERRGLLRRGGDPQTGKVDLAEQDCANAVTEAVVAPARSRDTLSPPQTCNVEDRAFSSSRRVNHHPRQRRFRGRPT